MEDAYLIGYYIDENNSLNIEKIVRDYSNYVFMIIKNNTQNLILDEDIEEMISDVFLILWNNKGKLDYNSPLKPYIAGITKNIAKDKLRRLNISYSFIETQEEIISKEDVEQFIEVQEEFEIILQELDRLGKNSNQIFMMFYFEGKKIRDIAKKLGYTEFNVSTKLHRIRKKIKKALEERGYKYGK